MPTALTRLARTAIRVLEPRAPLTTTHDAHGKERIIMSDDARAARQALQESMDLRDQGHTED